MGGIAVIERQRAATIHAVLLPAGGMGFLRVFSSAEG